ncbi:hypothetical protein DSECCO2_659870 [anaerobic digester metagenome]
MKNKQIILLLLLISVHSVSQTISVSSMSVGIIYRQLYPDGEYVKNSNLPNFDFRWRIEIFPEKEWRISVQPGVFSRLYSLHDEMYDNSFTSKRYFCPAVSVNLEKHFINSNETDKWCLFGGATITNLYENGVEWRSFKWLEWVDFTPLSYYLQFGGKYQINEKFSCYAQLNYPWIRNLNYLPVNAGLGSGNTSGAYLSTPTLGNERWSITAGVQFGFGKKKEE